MKPAGRDGMQIERRIGENRGKPRLWIEGAALASEGWKRGDRFALVFTIDGIDIERRADGKRKIAGTDARPIIDINTPKIRESVGAVERVTVSVERNRIAVRGV
jgi:DNA (cytosine-5)-methyltransferase 1